MQIVDRAVPVFGLKLKILDRFFLEGTNYDSNIFVKSEKPKLACSSGVKMQLAQIT